MAAKRLWGPIGFCIAAVLAALSLAHAEEEAAPAADFLVLAIKPEGDLKDYRMVPVGEAAIDPVQYRGVVKSLPRSLFGGVIIRPHDERAELAQCRTACAANAKCGNFTYVRPGKERPVGVCHLRRTIDKPATVAMTPVVENAAPATETIVVSPRIGIERKLVTIDSTRNGRTLYTPDQAPLAPVTFRFKAPVATAKADVRTTTNERVWANVEALDAKGRVFKRSGTWIVGDGAAHQILVRTEDNRIAALRLSTRDPASLVVNGVDFVRTADAVAEADTAEDPAAIEQAEADIPPPAPDLAAEAFPLPPRAEATEPPADITQPTDEQPAPEPQTDVAIAKLPSDGSTDAVITIPIAPTEAAPEPAAKPEKQLPEVPVLAAFGAAALLLGGTGLYRHNYRRRTLARLTTNILTDGRSRPAVTLSADEPDMSLRFTVRAHATVSARQTTITITPDGAAA
ncbi:MAG: hypothetical protein HOP13_20100 [Alphaproteobacteria bacterium]|nr:hypothetical protein [Alphaproteobacteria bacterium]